MKKEKTLYVYWKMEIKQGKKEIAAILNLLYSIFVTIYAEFLKHGKTTRQKQTIFRKKMFSNDQITYI
jgi:hypothetical protein